MADKKNKQIGFEETKSELLTVAGFFPLVSELIFQYSGGESTKSIVTKT